MLCDVTHACVALSTGARVLRAQTHATAEPPHVTHAMFTDTSFRNRRPVPSLGLTVPPELRRYSRRCVRAVVFVGRYNAAPRRHTFPLLIGFSSNTHASQRA